MNKLRLVYGKSRDAMYISQEDTIKIFSEAFSKAGLPVVKSKSTNMVDMMFAHPLTDGYESTGEIFEIYLSEEVDTRYLVREINRTLPAGFIVMSAEYVSSSEESINLRVYAAEYVVSLDYTEKFKNKTLREKEEIRAYYRKKIKCIYLKLKFLLLKKVMTEWKD